MDRNKVKIGIYGLWRGLAHIRCIEMLDTAEVTAILDKDPARVEEAKKHCSPDVRVCSDYDDLLNSGIDAVVLCNYLPEHAAAAIKALKKGIAVVSECLAAATMKQCVELVEAVEETKTYYSLSENMVYLPQCMEMERLYKSGAFGEVIFAEGEYNHPSSPSPALDLAPGANHWRKKLPRTYYLTHSMGPLMHMTGLMPKRVIGKVAAGRSYFQQRNAKYADSAGIMLVEMDHGVLFRVTGCNTYGPETHAYRLACDNGGIENLAANERMVSVGFNSWNKPEGVIDHPYIPKIDELTKKAFDQGLPDEGHLLADFRTVQNYITELYENRSPDMDVYRAAAMSAVGILGWRSVLNDSRQYDIPDFRDPQQREAYRNDNLSPWRGDFIHKVFRVEELFEESR